MGVNKNDPILTWDKAKKLRLKTYQTPHSCKKCGTFDRRVSDYVCIGCEIKSKQEKAELKIRKSENRKKILKLIQDDNLPIVELKNKKEVQFLFDVARRCVISERTFLATPKWANLEKISELYFESRIKSYRNGIKYEVDHIIPLNGESVSGLHVENNLRVITRRKNRKKWKKFDEKLLT